MTQIRVLSLTETIITVVWPFGKTECSRHRITKFPNSESPIFTTKFLFWFFYWFWEYILRLFWDLERIRKGCIISMYELQSVSPYCWSSKQTKFRCKYLRFGIQKIGCSMTWARYLYVSSRQKSKFGNFLTL